MTSHLVEGPLRVGKRGELAVQWQRAVPFFTVGVQLGSPNHCYRDGP